MKKVKIRKVEAGDEEKLAYIQTEAWKEGFKKILSREILDEYTNHNWAIEMYRDILKDKIGNGYILTIDNKPHCIAYWDKARDIEEDDYAEIICIHSLTQNWGEGYGSMMMEHVLKDIEHAGFNNVILWVFEENNRARKCYERNGFMQTEERKDFLGKDEIKYKKVIR
ncbi:GNAT family N-acetyltransferase [uncultured Clostridium sp.]|uniref:GNAT family N-acetyltransferase n=1 Tax=uncultured Clostridium sp. TaxID=59620 RepID=UPI002607A289|nr:GNAT family N-acetyltransferase [uncultured Clostridium sp.]